MGHVMELEEFDNPVKFSSSVPNAAERESANPTLEVDARESKMFGE